MPYPVGGGGIFNPPTPENTIAQADLKTFLGNNMNQDGLHDVLGEYVLAEYDVFLLGFNPIQGNYPFEHEDRMPFSPFTRGLYTPDNALILMLLLKAWKEPAAMKEITKMMETYMKSVASIIGDIAACGKTSYAANTNALMVATAILHKIGLINDGGVVRTQEHLRSVFDKMFEFGIFNTAAQSVTTLVEGSKVGQGALSEGSSGLSALLSSIKE